MNDRAASKGPATVALEEVIKQNQTCCIQVKRKKNVVSPIPSSNSESLSFKPDSNMRTFFERTELMLGGALFVSFPSIVWPKDQSTYPDKMDRFTRIRRKRSGDRNEDQIAVPLKEIYGVRSDRESNGKRSQRTSEPRSRMVRSKSFHSDLSLLERSPSHQLLRHGDVDHTESHPFFSLE
jgi:hypothetical protein